jgi:heterogeneous nuclear ribonucleoprotein R
MSSSACGIGGSAAGLESVELLMSKEIPGQNRGFCFLEFYNHACAQHAKAALSPPNFQCDIC